MDEGSIKLRDTLDKLLFYKKKFTEAEETIQSLEQKLKDSESELRNVQQQLTTAEHHLVEATKDKEATVEIPRLDVSVPVNTPRSLTTRSEQGGQTSTSSLKKEVARLQQELKKKEELLASPYRKSQVEDKLKIENRQLKGELKKYEKPKELIQEKDKEIKKKDGELATKTKQTLGLTQTVSALQGTLKSKEEELTELQQENQLFESSVAETLKDAEELAKSNNKLQEELQSHKTEAEKLKEELNKDEEDHSKRISEMERHLRLAQDSLHTVNKDAQKYQTTLKRSNEEHRKQLKGMENQLQQMKKMISALTNFMALQNEDTAQDGTAATVIATQMKPLIDMSDATEQECGLNAIYNVINDKSRHKIKQIKGLVPRVEYLTTSEYEYVKAAAQRTMMKIESDKVYPSYGRGLNIDCEYFQRCLLFIKGLNITESAWDGVYNMCYCSTCNAKRGFRMYFSRGEPPKDYGIPVGWCRFALKVPDAKADTHKIWEKWHVAFHGTAKESVTKVLEVGHLVVPGDTVLGGVRVGVRPFHIPESESTKKIFLSPTIRYAGMDTYASPSDFTSDSGQLFEAKVAFQVRINPQSYQMRGETVGASSQIDPAYLNEELEWFTNEHGSTELYGILVKLTPKKRLLSL